jgi:VIT1/CCC1 family predicted Fe2+/Mn2+ transporter
MSDRAEAHHQHRDVTGGWLRPSVFGAMDGSVSNFALIAGVLGAKGLMASGVVSCLALFAAGAIVSAVTARSWWYSGLRQLVVGAVAAGVTFGVGNMIGAAGR